MKLLKEKLQKIDRRGYKAYQELTGNYQDPGWQLFIDYVQPDPFANPSRLRVFIPRERFAVKQDWISTYQRRIACEDFFARSVADALKEFGTAGGTGNSGQLTIDAPGQAVLERTCVRARTGGLEIRLSAGLPARGRTVLGRQAETMLCQRLPDVLNKVIDGFSPAALHAQLQLADRQQAIREYLAANDLVAFVANGSVLPRRSGVSDLPVQGKGVVPFEAPPELTATISLPTGEKINGLAIRKGITLIVGGGYHGKSTLLHALERGVYNHVLGDGRDDATAVKIRAEDGRRVARVDISPFISDLPGGKSTRGFYTEDASGSTSQAANIIEALEVGSKLLLIDEDTSATNFMIRDARMQALIHRDKEPITPFVDKAHQLYRQHGVSSVLVIGGAGDYLDIADTVIMMDAFRPRDVTARAREVAASLPARRSNQGGKEFGPISGRIISPRGINASKGRRQRADARGRHVILLGTETIELSAVEQLVDPSQTRALARMLHLIAREMRTSAPLSSVGEKLFQRLDVEGLDTLSPFPGQHPVDMALPRPLELAAAINRLRTLEVE
ncbi:MAG: ATPase [Firmicutes bacterium]|nr:ATPase [Bacillota bacterium]